MTPLGVSNQIGDLDTRLPKSSDVCLAVMFSTLFMVLNLSPFQSKDPTAVVNYHRAISVAFWFYRLPSTSANCRRLLGDWPSPKNSYLKGHHLSDKQDCRVSGMTR
jgi:hypothetical protein